MTGHGLRAGRRGSQALPWVGAVGRGGCRGGAVMWLGGVACMPGRQHIGGVQRRQSRSPQSRKPELAR